MHYGQEASKLYGVLAQYPDGDCLLHAARRVHHEGYRAVDAFSPYPVEELAAALGQRQTWIPWIMLIGGAIGGGSMYGLQYWISVVAYPLNIGGRPLHSWPAFVPAAFECTVLIASLAGLLGMLALCGLPRLHHPLFEIPQFRRASTDAFFLCVEARDERFSLLETRQLLLRCGATEVWNVPLED